MTTRTPPQRGARGAVPRARAGTASLLVALVFLAYSDSFGGGFEGDSGALVTQDPRVERVTPANLEQIFTQQYWYPTADSAVYRPLVTLSLMFNYAVLGNGERARGYHAVNLALHLANVLFAWILALRIWKNAVAAFFTSAIFALHPVNSEAVANVAGRADLMAGLGVLVALLLHTERGESSARRRILGPAGIFVAALFGCFSKESAAVLPAAMLLYDAVFQRERPFPCRRRLPGYAAATSALAIMLLVRHAVLSRLPSPDLPFLDNPLVGADFWTARLTAIGVVWRYLGLLFWPHRLSWDYSYDQIPMATLPASLAALAGFLGVAAMLVWAYRRHPPACFFGAFFLLALAPVSNVLFLIGSIMAERFLYLPSLGFAGCVVALAAAAWTSPASTRPRPAIVALLALAVGALGLRTWHRNLDWTDGERLWASAAEASPKSYKTHLSVVYGMSRRGFRLENIDLAIREARTAAAILEKLPPLRSSASALTTLGTLYRMKGDLLVYRDPAAVGGWYRRALETLSAALPIDRAYAAERRRRELARGWPPERISTRGFEALYENLAETYRRLGQLPDAADALRHRIELAPLDPVFHAQLAGLEEEMGRREEAILSLWTADIVGATPELEIRLTGAYRRLDPTGCAAGPSAAKPNRDCPLVQTHLCSAELRLAALLANTGRPQEAERRRLEAVRKPGCSPP